jgi:hypothetical protein
MSEQLLAFRKVRNFSFSGRNFSEEYSYFKSIYKSLTAYADDDVLFTYFVYAALPQSVINTLPCVSFSSSDELYSMVAARLFEPKNFGSSQNQRFDSNGMQIDGLSASGFLPNEMFEIIDQYQDAMSDPDQAEDIIVALEAIRISRAHQNIRVSASACFYCQRPGHFIRDCRKRLGKLHTRISNNPSYRQNYEASHRPFRR